LVSERLTYEPSPESTTADWAISFSARKLGAAEAKTIGSASQAPNFFKTLKVGVAPRSRVGLRFKTLTWRQVRRSQERNVEPSRNG
jgi:hypothetical protein